MVRWRSLLWLRLSGFGWVESTMEFSPTRNSRVNQYRIKHRASEMTLQEMHFRWRVATGRER